MWLRYDDKMVDYWFNKETDYLLKLNTGQVRIAGLFKWTDDVTWEWVTNENNRKILRERITHYMVIPK